MFVTRSKYEEEVSTRRAYQMALNKLTVDWNSLVEKINDRGGMSCLDRNPSELTKKDIAKMIMLCHPDKHDGKPMANEVMAKLISIRDGL